MRGYSVFVWYAKGFGKAFCSYGSLMRSMNDDDQPTDVIFQYHHFGEIALFVPAILRYVLC